MPIYTNANLTSSLTAQSANFLPKMWKKGAELSEANDDFFMEFEGKGALSPVRVETDFTKDAGQLITFRNRAGLYADGVIGDELIDNNVEEWKVGEYQLEVDYLRHATRRNQRTEDQTGLRTEIEAGVNEDLGAWLGRKKSKHLSMMFREKLHVTSRVFANNAGSIDALRSADTITMDEIVKWGQMLKTGGGKAALVGRSGNNPILRYILVAVGEALVSLQNSSDYKTAQRDAGIRGATNVIFEGGYTDVNGHVIREYNPIDHDGRGAVGSAMNAKALLGVAITAGNDAQIVYGGNDNTSAALTQSKYFEFFPNYAYRFTPADILATDTVERYFLIYNLSGGDAGKMGMYAYAAAHNGNYITPTKRLRAADSHAGANIAYATVGNVTWNTGVWAGKHTDAHPLGSVVIECNSYGVPIGRSFMLGAQAAVRGYGRFRNERTEAEHDGGFVKDVFITSVFGQSPKKRVDGRTPNALVATHAITYQGLAIPTNIV